MFDVQSSTSVKICWIFLFFFLHHVFINIFNNTCFGFFKICTLTFPKSLTLTKGFMEIVVQNYTKTISYYVCMVLVNILFSNYIVTATGLEPFGQTGQMIELCSEYLSVQLQSLFSLPEVI